ncbi:MAG TPA: ATP-binding protein [Anaerolineaceae bacterium]|nr:ATP-binding protein [Anaerolineaceae bacterium]
MTAKSVTPTTLTPEILVPRLGDYLLEKGLISPNDLQKALFIQEERRVHGDNTLLGSILLEIGAIDRDVLDQAVTEQILQLRTALQDANRQLERRVQERTAELQDALEKLAELNQLKSNIVANISHELRTPLTHIKGYVELLLTEGLGPLTEQQVGAVQVMQRATVRLERQIEDLIHFSLVARGESSLRLSPVALGPLFETIAKRENPKAIEREIKLTTHLAADLPMVEADQEKISWVIAQLLDNAVKFTPPQGSVELLARLDHDEVAVSVRDTGIGIPSNRMEEIFEPFHQLDGSSTRHYGGTGLGLALVRQIVDAHGSVIRVDSHVGKGTQFEFLLKPAHKDLKAPIDER